MLWLLSPLSWLLFSGLLVAVAWFRRSKRILVIATTCACLSMATMTPLAANLLSSSLERGIQAPPDCSKTPASTAVVLGGGFEGWPRNQGDYSVLNLATRRRVDRAAEWWHQAPSRKLVLLGGPPYRRGPAASELMASYAISLGIPDESIRIETESMDTWENAEMARLISPALPRKVMLVTSSIHMWRAQEAFAAAGFAPCPLGSDIYHLPSRIPWALVPRTRALSVTEFAVHEWVGLLWYRWRRWRDGIAPVS